MNDRYSGISKHRDVLSSFEKAICKASEILLQQQGSPGRVSYKKDGSPVCDVDRRSSGAICELLVQELSYQILCEEAGLIGEDAKRYITVDPLDSTSSYLGGGDHFGVILSLNQKCGEGDYPLVGMCMWPRTGQLSFAVKGEGAHTVQYKFGFRENNRGEENRIVCQNGEGIYIIVSGTRTSNKLEDTIQGINPRQQIRMGGALKIVKAAGMPGGLFLAPPKNRYFPWDISGPILIAREAGAKVTNWKGEKPSICTGISSTLFGSRDNLAKNKNRLEYSSGLVVGHPQNHKEGIGSINANFFDYG